MFYSLEKSWNRYFIIYYLLVLALIKKYDFYGVKNVEKQLPFPKFEMTTDVVLGILYKHFYPIKRSKMYGVLETYF